MRPYTIHFKNGTSVSGLAEWDGKHVEDLLMQFGMTATEARLRIDRVSPDSVAYEAAVDSRACEKEAA